MVDGDDDDDAYDDDDADDADYVDDDVLNEATMRIHRTNTINCLKENNMNIRHSETMEAPLSATNYVLSLWYDVVVSM